MGYQNRNVFPYVVPLAAFEVASATSRAMLHSMSAFNAEMAKFVGHRLEVDAKLQDELSRSTNAFDVFEAMSKFYQTAFADYTKEAEKLGEVAATAAEENLISMEAGLKPKKATVTE